jgi:hypothetical protein
VMDQLIGAAIIFAGASIVLCGVGLSLYQCVLWLKDGHWTSIELRELWSRRPLGIEWVGLRQIVEWFVELPLSVVAVLLGAYLIWFGSETQEGR